MTAFRYNLFRGEALVFGGGFSVYTAFAGDWWFAVTSGLTFLYLAGLAFDDRRKRTAYEKAEQEQEDALVQLAEEFHAVPMETWLDSLTPGSDEMIDNNDEENASEQR